MIFCARYRVLQTPAEARRFSVTGAASLCRDLQPVTADSAEL